MGLYRITVELKSPLITPLKGDTIWGHIVWGIARHEGDEGVGAFLADCEEASAFAVSSAFPAGYICRPLPPVGEEGPCKDTEEYAARKKEKKRRFVSADTYIQGESDREIPCKDSLEAHTEVVVHNVIDRLSGTVGENGLYAIAESRYLMRSKEKLLPSLFDIYVHSPLDAARITELFNWAFETGYGADASVGRGHITVSGEALAVSPRHSGSTWMSLGPFVRSKDDGIENLRADIFTRTGRLGGDFSGLSPYKKTVVLFNEGAVFESARQLSAVGMLLHNIHADERICQSGFAPVIPIPEGGGNENTVQACD